ncbi:MAG TPA: thioredoxin-disulfide reductase [Ignavibacteria bacterium]|nr:thioredoxin-disulfide reductase [Ignavibacteria bacterium]
MADNNTNHSDVIIIGSGPAGFTAAIYTARANLNPVIFEGPQPGGQLMITTDIENYPGFEHGISGPMLMDIMRKQAQRFGAKTHFKTITRVDFSKKPFTVFSDDGTKYTSDAVIISTGASAKYLGLPSEKEYAGFGVSACATCDGFFFKNLKVAVVGGGDTAMEEATYLTHHAAEVVLIHRREEFRASKIMVDRVKTNPKIKFLLNCVVEEVVGKNDDGRKSVTGLRVKNVKTGETFLHECDGVFLAIGHKPNTDLFKGILDMDETGYLKTDKHTMKTKIEGVFACGDCQDSYYRQAVSASGTGCMAAIDVERYLANLE